MQIYPLDNQVSGNQLFVKRPHVSCWVAPPGKGKTTVMLNLLLNPQAYCGFYDQIYVFSQNFHSDEKQKLLLTCPVLKGKKPVPADNVFLDYDTTLLDEILVQCDDRTRNTLIIVDDLTLKATKDPHFHQMLVDRRHKGISVWLTGQRLKIFHKALRTMSDTWFVFELGTRQELIEAWEDIGVKYGLDQKQFQGIIQHCTIDTFGFAYFNGSPNGIYKNLESKLSIVPS